MTDIRLSLSKTKTFIDCKKKYEFSYIKKFPKKDRDYHILGKFCHKVLEDFHLEYLGGCEDPFDVVMKRCFKTALSEYSDKMTPEMKKECWVMIDQYLKIVSDDKKNKLSANVIAVEKKFDFALSDNVMLTGMIDRIQIDADDIVHVADYKTSKNIKYLKNDWFQLLTYMYVILQENPDLKKIRGSYIMLRHNYQYITTEFSVPEIMAVKDKYLDYAAQIINEKEFPANPTFLCGYCDFQEHCIEGRSKSFNNQNTYGEVNW